MSTPLAQYGAVLLSQWRWIMWGILLAFVATTVFLILWPPLYRAEATVFVRTPGDVSRVQDGGDSYAQGRAGTYAALVKSTSVSSRVVADLGQDLSPEVLSQRIQATHPRGTALIESRSVPRRPLKLSARRPCCFRSTQRPCAHWNRCQARWFHVPSWSSSTPPGQCGSSRGLGCAHPGRSARRNPNRAGSRFVWGRASLDSQKPSTRSQPTRKYRQITGL